MPNDGRPPAFMFYPADFASDGKVEAMTTEEVGAYILLLCKAWREDPPGSVPDDDRVLARWARLTSDQWSAARSAVLGAFTQGKDGRWYQPRMVRESEKQRSFAKSRHNAAKVAAAKRWEDKPDDASGMRHASDTHPERMPEARSSSSSSSSEKKDSGTTVPGEGSPPARAPSVIWDLGVSMLRNAGMGEQESRSLLGGLRKKHGQSAVATAIAETSAANAIEPREYLIRVLNNGRSDAHQRVSGEAAPVVFTARKRL